MGVNVRVIDVSTGELVWPMDGYHIHLYEKESGEFVSGLENVSQEDLDDLYDRLGETHRFEMFI